MRSCERRLPPVPRGWFRVVLSGRIMRGSGYTRFCRPGGNVLLRCICRSSRGGRFPSSCARNCNCDSGGHEGQHGFGFDLRFFLASRRRDGCSRGCTRASSYQGSLTASKEIAPRIDLSEDGQDIAEWAVIVFMVGSEHSGMFRLTRFFRRRSWGA
jgi:hypothetical protein